MSMLWFYITYLRLAFDTYFNCLVMKRRDKCLLVFFVFFNAFLQKKNSKLVKEKTQVSYYIVYIVLPKL
jgi:hypothetical protein